MSDTIEAKTPRKRKPHFFVTFSHWSMVLLLALSLLTGMRLGWGYLESGLGGPYGMWATLLNAIAPRGTLLGINLITLHVTLAFLFLLNTCMYAGYLFLSGDTRRLRFTNRDLKSLLTGLVTRQFRQNKRALWSANLLVYWIAFTFVAVLLVTGVALYREDWGLSQLLGGYGAMRLLHGFAAYLFLPYIILHITLQWWFGQFWSIFRIQWHRPHLKAGLIGLALSLMAVGGVYGWNQRLKTLTVPRITQASGTPVLDGKPHDPAWQQAQPVTIRTVKGINNPHDFVDVDVKALHDGQHIYFRMQWDDPDVSSKRF
ncbi:cytochrome b/b6 domain-containing protein, partial [Candidatus Entotheonella palauensis]